VQDLGHPLLPPDQKVRNSFALQQTGEGVLITGSNMAGKSTFLKSLGLNQVLAQAGTVVDASRYQAPLLRVVCCIRVSDSINDGLSYFYAEVTRLKVLLQAIEAEHPLPVLFLVDEIFKGTNNRERLLGSRAYIQALTGKNALGGVSTHDLELVKLADSNPLLQNYHFREQIIDGQMVFDYTLRPGPCPTTNALRIMALAGLPVPDFPPEPESQASEAD
jgi:DNA mismatch repair ATPase MutS